MLSKAQTEAEHVFFFQVREQVSQLLAALLSRLAALEKYEEFLHRITTEASIGEPIAAVSSKYHALI